jgi:predicted nucleic acid-binding protein
MPEIIIADTSSLIGFVKIDSLNLLREMYGRVVLTKEVADEYGGPLPDWFEVRLVNDREMIQSLLPALHLGEASAIALAIETKNATLVIDEKDGRSVASQLGIRITGTLGILLKAKKQGRIAKLRPLVEKLRNKGFRISEQLLQEILMYAEE